jgi:hypothetical protein
MSAFLREKFPFDAECIGGFPEIYNGKGRPETALATA